MKMNSNYHFKRLLDLIKESEVDIPGLRLVAQSENGFDNLFLNMDSQNVILCLRRDNMICEIVQAFDAPAAFDLEVLRYNNREPYLCVTLGKFISILHLV
jgi:hypothetical protein